MSREANDVAGAYALQARIAEAARGSGHPVIDAGRGQPNWTVTEPRAAFFRLGLFATEDADRYSTTDVWGEMPPVAGIHDRLLESLAADTRSDPGTAFLRQAVAFAIAELGFDPDAWVHELVRSVLGFGYPSPNRFQPHLEKVAERYVLGFTGTPSDDDHRFDLFATEGGAAAMTYIFTTLQVNELVAPGDAVAVATPTYTPYLQIPILERIGFDVVEIKAVAHQPHRFEEGALEVLRDPRIKVFFLINPGNPDSRAVRPERLEELRQIIETDRPDLLVVNDTAYATFVDGFHGVTATIPRNTILLHSFSKGYAATGNRLGFIAVNKDSVVDRLLAEKPADAKERLRMRYHAASADVEGMPFIQRLLADSREVALHNIAGLATPDQVQMTLFELAFLMPEGAHYVVGAREKLQGRLNALYEGLGLTPPGGKDSHYYGMVDVMTLARARHGDEVAARLREAVTPEEVALRLAADSGVVVQTGPSFQGDPWDVRLSLASITEDEAGRVARAFVELVDRLVAELP
ncbi:MAG TPA: bifunctional aspartate transaminase/aspartate 4-decarboxylase [Lapillicoccus sp.]|nr:bifunctional aspartate transaminase/aspartate 4-decarboxylase [Lapillicoccus sp.]